MQKARVHLQRLTATLKPRNEQDGCSLNRMRCKRDGRIRQRWTVSTCHLKKVQENDMIVVASLRPVSAPGRVQRQVKLAEMEGATGNAIRGTANWIGNGIKLQEMQYVIWRQRNITILTFVDFNWQRQHRISHAELHFMNVQHLYSSVNV